VVALLLAASPTRAQTIVGHVLDELRESPVVGAAVKLVDRDGEERALAIADSTGRFVITPPIAGEYELRASRLGYRAARSPLLSLTTEGTANVDLLMMPAPIGLEGLKVSVDVSAEAAAQLEIAGVEPKDLGRRWVTQSDIDAIAVKRDVGTLLEWQGIGGMRVIRSENQTTGSEDIGMCVSLNRARTFKGEGRCALPVIDGVPSNNFVLRDLDPLTVSAMALLTPIEATFLYGKRGEAGAVLVWTRRR
jgi:Carboxypeptidase regulatory-like domain